MMDFVKREDQNVLENDYRGYADVLQKLHHMETTMGEFQTNPIMMEHIHQAMQNINASNLVHNIQLPMSPRQMSNIMFKTNRNFNFSADLHIPRNLEQEYLPRNDLDLDLTHNLPEIQDVRHNDLAQNLRLDHDLSYLNRDMIDERRHQYVSDVIDQRIGHSIVQEPHQGMPLPFQIKSEQEDFYDTVAQGFVHNGLHGDVPLDQNQMQEQFVYNTVPAMSVPHLGSWTQNYTQNYPVNVSRDNPENLVVNRQYDYVADDKSSDSNDTGKIDGATDNIDGRDENSESFLEKDENSQKNDEDVPLKSLVETEYANIKGEYLCYKCNNIFPSKRGLKVHSKTCLENGESPMESTEKVGKFFCSQCPYKCQSPAILKIHERTHTGEKPFSCTFCDYKSGQKNNVAKHILVHMKEKPFGCQYCDYRCAQKNNLVVHERTHTGYKPFACPYCDYRTVQKPNLVKHMYLHTDERPFSCDRCNYKCVQKTNLTKHKLRHLNESEKSDFVKANKPYRPRQKSVKCAFCAYSCVQKSSLDKHVEFKHGDQKPGYGQQSEFQPGAANVDAVQNLSLRKSDDGSEEKAVSELVQA